MSFPDELRRAAALLQAGQKDLAMQVLLKFLKLHPDSDMGWLMLSYALSDPKQQRASVVRALRIDPQNARARTRLDELLKRHSSLPSKSEPAKDEAILPGKEGATERPSPAVPALRERASDLEKERRTTDLPDEPGPIPSIQASSAAGRSEGDIPKEVAKARPNQHSHWLILLVLGMLVVAILGGSAFILLSAYLPGDDQQPIAPSSVAFDPQDTLTTAPGQRLPPTWTPISESAATHTSQAPPTALPAVTATIPAPNPTASAEMKVIQEQVASLRGLPIQSEVEHYFISRADIRPILERHYFSQAGSIESINEAAIIMEALGLIRPGYDLLTNILNSFTDSLGGFYFPDTKQVFVVGMRFTGIEHFIYSHEYGHALVDQHFDLQSFEVYPSCKGNQDRCKAIQALIEGDAVLLMGEWLEQYASYDDYQDILNYRPPRQILPEESPPPFALKDAEFPYIKGLEFVEYLYGRGGWGMVNEAYRRPPESTEQILHFEKYLIYEAPIIILGPPAEQALGQNWRKLAENTLGEWMTYLILGYAYDLEAQVQDEIAKTAAEGWGGDQYQVFLNEQTQEVVLLAHWIWDGVQDSDEFSAAMRAYMQGRYQGRKVERTQGECWEIGDQLSCLYRSGREIMWLQTPGPAIMDAIHALYPGFR